jgi:hypothetical protein
MPFALHFYYFIAFLGNISPFLDVKLTGVPPESVLNNGCTVRELAHYSFLADGPFAGLGKFS